MKRTQFGMLLFSAASLLISCGSNDSTEKTETTTGDTVSSQKPVTTEVNTIVTTPQNMMTVLGKIPDFAKWQPTYDERDSARLANGLHNYVIGRGFNDSTMVLVALRADAIDKAKAYAKDPGLKKAMQKGGITGTPTISFFTAVWQDTAVLAPGTLRSRTTFSVKDWDAWFKSFQESKQQRMDNGIVDRVIGHDADDNKKVTLVTAVLDTAKAFAYYKSDALKQRRAAGGVIGEPQRFLFYVVKRY